MYNNRQQTVNPKTFFRMIVMVHLALLIGQLIFAVVVVFSFSKGVVDLKPGSDPLFYIAPFMVVGGMLAGTLIFNKLMAKSADKATTAEKVTGYQSAFIIRCALSEGPVMFTIVCVLITGNLYYIILAGINFIYFVSIRPTKLKIEDGLNLSYVDKAEMDW